MPTLGSFVAPSVFEGATLWTKLNILKFDAVIATIRNSKRFLLGVSLMAAAVDQGLKDWNE